MPNEVDTAILKRAQAGDATALTTLYEQYKPDVYRYLYYRVGRPQLAEDLTTEVFIRVMENLSNYRQRNVPFRAWLFQIARNLTVDYFRKMNRRDDTILDEKMIAEQPDPETVAELRLTADQLQQALQHLPPSQCDVIVLRFIAEMPISQVAQTLKKSESAIKALQARGLEALHIILSPQMVPYGK